MCIFLKTCFMTEMTSTRVSGRRMLTVVIFIISIGIGLFFIFRGCAGNISPEVVNIVLEKNGKKYLYSPMRKELVQMSIDRGESPAAMRSILVYKDGEDYFLDPAQLSAVAGIMSGRCNLHAYREASYDGYVTSTGEESYVFHSRFKSTENIGRQLTFSDVTLFNARGDSMMIQWKFDPTSGEYHAIKNCQVHAFWVQTNPSPGETVISSKYFLVVPLRGLARFFHCRAAYSEEQKLLFVRP